VIYAMPILDTDILIAFLRGKEKAVSTLKNLKKQDLPIKTTIFNAAELFKGCYSAKNVAKSINKIQSLLSSLHEILPFEESAMQEYAKISSDLKKRGLMSGTMDELIAGVCMANNETLYTGNIRHFEKIPELSLINWRKKDTT